MNTRRVTPLLIFLVLLIACAADQRQKTLRVSLAGLNAARDGFAALDLARQKALLGESTSREDAEKKLATYKSAREKVVAAFEIAYRMISAAATQNDDPSLRAALAASKKLLEDIEALMKPTAKAAPTPTSSTPATEPTT